MERFARPGCACSGRCARTGSRASAPSTADPRRAPLPRHDVASRARRVDLLRDPRCVVHNTVTDKSGTEGDFKLYGAGARRRTTTTSASLLRRAGERRSAGAPDSAYHLFEIAVTEVGWYRYEGDETHDIRVWRLRGQQRGEVERADDHRVVAGVEVHDVPAGGVAQARREAGEARRQRSLGAADVLARERRLATAAQRLVPGRQRLAGQPVRTPAGAVDDPEDFGRRRGDQPVDASTPRRPCAARAAGGRTSTGRRRRRTRPGRPDAQMRADARAAAPEMTRPP